MNISISQKSGKNRKLIMAIGWLWLVHLSGIIGISLGYIDFFISKTPFNLLLGFVLLISIFPLSNMKKGILTLVFFGIGMLVEWIGVHNAFLFGSYYYGNNLGPMLDGVPWLIGINWAMLVIITGAIANQHFKSVPLKILVGAGLMLLLDFFMEVPAPVFDFWIWRDGAAPLQNFITWFAIATFLHLIFQRFEMKGNYLFSKHLYLCQLVFFAYFFAFYSLKF